MTGFRYFIGIDQTGASRNNKALPLPSALINLETNEISIEPLETLCAKSLLRAYPDVDLAKTFILVDSVLGLPQKCIPRGNFGWSYFNKAHVSKEPVQQYGRETAHEFFAQFRVHLKDLPHRKCEILANANSVFNKTPFQKNIATGTHRIWKDLGSTQKWAFLFHFEKFDPKKGPWLAEGYPSFLWKNLLGFKNRKPEKLPSFLQTNSPFRVKASTSNSLRSNQNYADAAVLAYGAWKMSQHADFRKIPKFRGSLKEGWILGLKL